VAMVQIVDREAVQELAAQGGRLVEVLPQEEYTWAHLPGAVNLPLAGLEERAGKELEPDSLLIVYCHDLQCDLSPRAARRLERLGYSRVFDYAVGKMDWLSYDLPYEGEAILVSQRVRRDPIEVGLDDSLEVIADRILADPARLGVVIDHDRVVHGVLGKRELTAAGAGAGASAEAAMRAGVTTVRPSEEVGPLTQRMDSAGVSKVVVSRSDGTLVGLFTKTATPMTP
jgi:rhodanese-related sulfurtransferase